MNRMLALSAFVIGLVLIGGSPAGGITGTSGRIIYESVGPDDSQSIYSANADGSGMTRLSPSHFTVDAQPVYSPDGMRVAFLAVRDVPWPQIYTMNVDGSGLTRVTNNTFVDASPSWSPDGSKLTFDSQRNGNIDIYVINVDGSGEVRLTTGTEIDGFPSWSPDGTKIAFQSDRTGNFEIFVMNADGSAQQNVTNNGADDLVPDWSPSGERFVFVRQVGENYDVFSMNANGSQQTRLTTSPADDSTPEWSPDGARVLFSTDRGQGEDIWSMNADGTGQAALIKGSEDDQFADWAPPTCTVASVQDGDTFTCNDGTVVDLLQIDAPELTACGGDWAHAALSNIFLTPGRVVALSFDDVSIAGNTLAAPIVRGTDGIAYNISIVMAYVGLAKASMVGIGNTKYLDWANASQTWAQVAQWNMWAPGKPFNGGC